MLQTEECPAEKSEAQKGCDSLAVGSSPGLLVPGFMIFVLFHTVSDVSIDIFFGDFFQVFFLYFLKK